MLKNIFKKGITFILEWEARLVLKKYKPSIIAITGSVGKTSTKDAIYEVIRSKYHARKSEKSYNNELGVPLTILNLETGWNSPLIWIKNCFKGLLLIILKNHYPAWLVLEVGVDRPGDMKRITRWLSPSIVVITRFAEIPPHVEFFDNPEHLYDEKWHLSNSLKKGGTLIVNNDDKILLSYTEKHREIKTLSYGLSSGASLHATDLHITYASGHIPKGITFKAINNKNEVPINLSGTIGYGHVYAVLAALLVGNELDINLVAGAEALSTMEPTPGRMKLLLGINESVIIDDSYNASPDALSLALDSLYDLEITGKKIVVLGDMLELGKFAHEAHTQVGELLSKQISALVLVGPRARFIVEEKKGGLRDSQIVFCENAEEAGEYLKKKIKAGDAILVKGSQRVRLEKTIKEILQNPDDAQYLVRQDKEWKNR